MNRRAPLLSLGVGFLLGAAAGLADWPSPLPLPALLLMAASPPLAPVAFAAAGWLAVEATRTPPEEAPDTPVEVEGDLKKIFNFS